MLSVIPGTSYHADVWYLKTEPCLIELLRFKPHAASSVQDGRAHIQG